VDPTVREALRRHVVALLQHGERRASVPQGVGARAAAQLWRFGPKAWKPYFDIRDPVEIERRANAEIPLAQVYADWVIGTDPEVHAKALRDLFESGATEVNVHSGQADQRRVIDFYGSQVLPRLARG
jgi:hypothetical protein